MDQYGTIGSQRIGRYWRWSEAEVALLKSGQPIQHRTARACEYKRHSIGVRIRPGNYLTKAHYHPPKPVPGKIPWPTWWRRAHLMRVEGCGAAEIARTLGKEIKSVRAALYPSEYEMRAQRYRRWRQKPEARAKEQERLKTKQHDPVRGKIRRLARIEWRAAGGDPRALERFYRVFDCL